MLLHLVGLGVGDRRLAHPGNLHRTPLDSRAVNAFSDPTISWSILPFGFTAVGASSAATSVGAMSISAGWDSNGFTPGPHRHDRPLEPVIAAHPVGVLERRCARARASTPRPAPA